MRPAVFFAKPSVNPILTPKAENGWEAWQTFNPGVVLLDGTVHFLYRAIGGDGISRLGYAASHDGFVIRDRLPRPAYEHSLSRVPTRAFAYYSSGGSWGGCEDPRIVRVGNEDTLYMTYTACDGGLRVALTSIGMDDFLKKRWRWSAPAFLSPPDEAHKNWVIFPEKINGRYAILHSINPMVAITYVDELKDRGNDFIRSVYGGETRNGCWDTLLRGVGPPPIKTEDGWLLFYHAMDGRDYSKYKVGAMLLDLNDPTRVLCRAQEPVLEPDERYENDGYKAGVVYASGAVVKDGTLLVYYGGADNYVCVASANLEEFLGSLRRSVRPTFLRDTVK